MGEGAAGAWLAAAEEVAGPLFDQYQSGGRHDKVCVCVCVCVCVRFLCLTTKTRANMCMHNYYL